MRNTNLKFQKPKVSIVIPNYNGRNFLEQCINSIVSNVSDSISYEIIVVDDASTDGSAEMVMEKFPSVHLIRNEKELFATYCLNQGIRESQGEYIHFLMPDTYLTVGTEEKLIDFLDNREDVWVITSRLEYPDGRFQQNATRDHNLEELFLNYTFLGKLFPKWKKEANNIRTYAGWDWEHEQEIENAGFTHMVIRKQVFNIVGMLDTSLDYFAEDDFCMRVKSKGGKICYMPSGKIIHYVRGVVKKAGIKKRAKIYERNIFQFTKKYYGFLIALILKILIWISNILISIRERKPTRVTEIFLTDPKTK